MAERKSMDDLAQQAIEAGDAPRIQAILEEVCRLTGMGFAAVALVTDTRWIACQVLDRIGFGLDAGSELELKTTICDEIRVSGEAVVVDDIGGNDRWRMHHTPMMYGFQSYASLPIYVGNHDFFGTLCAIDPSPRPISGPETIAILRRFADEIGAIVAARRS